METIHTHYTWDKSFSDTRDSISDSISVSHNVTSTEILYTLVIHTYQSGLPCQTLFMDGTFKQHQPKGLAIVEIANTSFLQACARCQLAFSKMDIFLFYFGK